MRVRDFQQVLGKFTNDQKGTIISDCPIYIETMDGRLEEIRRIELQESRLINSPEPARIGQRGSGRALLRRLYRSLRRAERRCTRYLRNIF